MAGKAREDLLERIRVLEQRLEEAEETLRALGSGEVDALVVSGPDADRVYTLKGADEAYRTMVEKMAEGALTLTLDGLILFSNERFAGVLGLPLERVIGARIQDFVAPEDADALSALLSGMKGRQAELRLKREAAAPVPVYLSVDNLILDGVERICLMVTDLTEQKRNQEIVAAEKLARSILEQAAEAILVVEPSGRIIRASRAAERLAGTPVVLRRFDEAFKVSLATGADYPFREILLNAERSGAINAIEATARMPDGRKIDLLLSAAALRGPEAGVLGCVVTLTDVTERKQREERLRQIQKLESIGLLAGGIAHDFNNLLVGVMGNASLAQEMLPPGHHAVELLQGVIKAGEQLANLTRQMLAYSGKGRFYVESLDLSELIPEMSGLVQPSIFKKIALHFELEPDLPPIEADRGQMQQVFMNLVLNAAEAIGSDAGLISVKTGVRDIDGQYIRRNHEAAELRPGKYVYLEVRDTGCGMEPATMAKIFDPFFSTKFTGRGLGLAAVGGIVRGHKGAIKVTSAPGKGSCFTVLLPAGQRRKEQPQAADYLAVPQGKGTVLMVDDEEIVREMAKKALTRYGYEVLLASDGLEAIDILKRHPGGISLVVLDQSMPGMSGEEVLPELRRVRPGINVVVSSGYNEAETMALFRGHQVGGFIQKPYTSSGLAEKVKSVLA